MTPEEYINRIRQLSMKDLRFGIAKVIERYTDANAIIDRMLLEAEAHQEKEKKVLQKRSPSASS